MTVLPELRLDPESPAESDVDVLVVAVEKSEEGPKVRSSSGLPEPVATALQEAASAIGYAGAKEKTARVPAPGGVRARSVLLVGWDGAAEDTGERLRRVAGVALRALDDVSSVALALPVEDAEDAEAVATGALLGAYRYTAYRSDPAGPVPAVVVSAPVEAGPGLERAGVIARAVFATRDLVNDPPLDLYPATFAAAVADRAEALPVTVDVLDEGALEERGFGGILGVGRGSVRGPRLVKVSYAPEGAARHLALVGKGITFDSGGISLKPAAKMEKMKNDMAGAAAAVHALFAVAELGLPVRVTAWLALAENMPSGSAMRPADVLRMYGGKTVEVMNTDAEGRLVLADALVAAQEESPDLVVDLATLTGAQVAALGFRTSGVMGTATARDLVIAASETSGEPLWPMPIPEEMIGYFSSPFADLRNAGAPAGGMLAAAAFLREFVRKETEWAHLDIAGPAYTADAPFGYTVVGGTGVPVRTLVELAESLAV